MTDHTSALKVGARIQWEGEAHIVTGFSGAAVLLRSARGWTGQIRISDLCASPSFRVITPDSQHDRAEVVTFVDNVPPAEISKAEDLLAHLLEARTGYRRGSAASALPGEPRLQYDPRHTNLSERMEAKARELNRKRRWIFKMQGRYQRLGIYGLIDQRTTKLGGDQVDSRVKDVVRGVLDELTEQSNISQNQIARRVARKLKEKYPDDGLNVPPATTFHRLLRALARGRGTFGSGKARRSIANRPPTSYSHFVASRPGEMVPIDSSPLDAYALDPYSFQWVQIQLTIADDLLPGA